MGHSTLAGQPSGSLQMGPFGPGGRHHRPRRDSPVLASVKGEMQEQQ